MEKTLFQVSDYKGCVPGWVTPQKTVKESPDTSLYDRPQNAIQDASKMRSDSSDIPFVHPGCSSGGSCGKTPGVPENVLENAPENESSEGERFLRGPNNSPNGSKALSNPLSAGKNGGMTTGRDSDDESSEGLPSLDLSNLSSLSDVFRGIERLVF